ncbi:MAG: hypothetical protein IPK76_00560 [Lewinellaceae bacterium]|nr:hypothetical protein [Lewinellaceae bacterium]
MANTLRHWYYLSRAAVWLTLAFVRAAWYFRLRAMRVLDLPTADTFSSKEKRRLQHYFYGTTYLGAVFGLLRGYPRNNREKRLFTNLAALAYYFDDLTDTLRGKEDTGILWQDNPETYGRTADPSGRALHFLHNIYRALPPGDLDGFRDFMHRVFNVETAGRQSGTLRPDVEELARITAEKGGYSVLLFRRVMSHTLLPAEKEAIFQFGYLVQLCDDIFDLWHDRQAGVATTATFYTEQNNLPALAHIFEAQVETVKRTFSKASDRIQLARQAMAAVHFIVSITRVCLQHYADLAKKHGTLPLDNRAEMVVDMERWSNRLRAARALLKDS